MAYQTLVGVMMIGVQAIMAYFSVNFNSKEDLFGKIMQTLFLILCVGLIPVDVAIINASLVVDGLDGTDLADLMGTVYFGAVTFAVTFIALMMVRLIYNGLVKPLQDFEHPDKALMDQGVLR